MRSGESGSTTAAARDVAILEFPLRPDVAGLPIGSGDRPRFGSGGFYGAAKVAAAYC
jgi:hypothetical protein